MSRFIFREGEASDGLKRAAVNFGVSRELYTSEFLWIPSSKVDIGRKNNLQVTNERFHVADIQYDDERNISYLRIMNASNEVVYERRKVELPNEDGPKLVSQEQIELLRKELQRTGVAVAAVLGRYCLESEQQISEDIYRKAMNGLKRTKSLRKAA